MVTSLISMSSHCEPKVAYNRQPDLDESKCKLTRAKNAFLFNLCVGSRGSS